MIINNNKLAIESNVEPSKALNFGISDVRLVVDILSKLYAYPIRTLVQEYICNGRDAMREAGTWGKVPMVITVPNSLEPSFKVRDFGVGISPDRMENIFVNYGSSTKRNTNTQTGGFGIGAKSAFAYTDSFAITSYFNGMKYLYIAHLGESGGVNLISSEKTSERNGVEINIGVKPKDSNEFLDAVSRCVRFWQEEITFIGTKGIDRKVPIVTLGNMCVYSGSDSRTIFLIDGIEYPLLQKENRYFRSTEVLESSDHIVAINIPNGYFKIASSRERLENNDDNMQKQEQVVEVAKSWINNLIEEKFSHDYIPLETKLKTQQQYSGLNNIKNLVIDITKEATVSHGKIRFRKAWIPSRFLNRSRRGKQSIKLDDGKSYDVSSFELSNVVLFKSSESDMVTARKINHHIETTDTSPDRYNYTKYINYRDIPLSDDIKEILFKRVIDVDKLTLPPKKPSASSVVKNPKGSVGYVLAENGGKIQWSMDYINKTALHKESEKLPYVVVYGTDYDCQGLSEFMRILVIPLCNKDIFSGTKGLTVEEGKKWLLKEHSKRIGLFISEVFHKVDCLKHIPVKKNITQRLENYLFAIDPSLKKEYDKWAVEFLNLQKKYPLLSVLERLRHDEHHASIVADAINKQTRRA